MFELRPGAMYLTPDVMERVATIDPNDAVKKVCFFFNTFNSVCQHADP